MIGVFTLVMDLVVQFVGNPPFADGPNWNLFSHRTPLILQGCAKRHPGNPIWVFNNLRNPAPRAARIFPV